MQSMLRGGPPVLGWVPALNRTSENGDSRVSFNVLISTNGRKSFLLFIAQKGEKSRLQNEMTKHRPYSRHSCFIGEFGPNKVRLPPLANTTLERLETRDGRRLSNNRTLCSVVGVASSGMIMSFLFFLCFSGGRLSSSVFAVLPAPF